MKLKKSLKQNHDVTVAISDLSKFSIDQLKRHVKSSETDFCLRGMIFWDLVDTRLDCSVKLPLSDILFVKDYANPPENVLRKIVEKYNTLDDLKLLLKFPVLLSITDTHGNLLLHKCAKKGWSHRKLFHSFIIEGINNNVGSENGIGGLLVKNKVGVTPLSIFFSFVVGQNNCCNKKWEEFCSIIRTSFIQYHSLHKETEYPFSDSNESIPFLHSLLNFNCPLGIINRILDNYPKKELISCDRLGRTPLCIAVSNFNNSNYLVFRLIQMCPDAALLYDKSGNLPLHHAILSGTHADAFYMDRISLITTMSPKALEKQNSSHKLFPFMLAALNRESKSFEDSCNTTDNIYRLLRSVPWIIGKI